MSYFLSLVVIFDVLTIRFLLQKLLNILAPHSPVWSSASERSERLLLRLVALRKPVKLNIILNF